MRERTTETRGEGRSNCSSARIACMQAGWRDLLERGCTAQGWSSAPVRAAAARVWVCSRPSMMRCTHPRSTAARDLRVPQCMYPATSLSR